ncbi:30S ribosomal protein S13 [Thermospira aquatica]|uniref:Small ribosomal subunit protein uS13 n=1 Tax=Thermospira aquatica TaxID=2828656 RepID=A0AAX3BAA5_9SPIR|nr:30S ribosomal protein S13 [Thermospira aquatica]URA09060.1 30S ribosomal protein S13 [Thermospira aquatica]
MARIAGREIPGNKAVFIGLTYIYGIGQTTANKIVEMAKIDPHKKVKDLTEEELAKIRDIIESNFKVEGDLRTEVAMNIKRLIDIGCYRGLRHKNKLPVRGQRTRTNARTRKGPRPNTIKKKK